MTEVRAVEKKCQVEHSFRILVRRSHPYKFFSFYYTDNHQLSLLQSIEFGPILKVQSKEVNQLLSQLNRCILQSNVCKNFIPKAFQPLKQNTGNEEWETYTPKVLPSNKEPFLE